MNSTPTLETLPHTEVDFLTWGHENLARLAAELHKENKRLTSLKEELDQANAQLQLDLRDAMKEARKVTTALALIEDEEVMSEIFGYHSSAVDSRLSRVEAPEFIKSVLTYKR